MEHIYIQGFQCSDVLAQKILLFQTPKMRFSAFWAMNLRTKVGVFHSRKYSFQFISHTLNSYKQ